MNVALYIPSRGHSLLGREFYEGCTRDEAREMALLMQIEALKTGRDMGDALMVAWENSPSTFLSVFTLGDEFSIDETMLNEIHSLVMTKH